MTTHERATDWAGRVSARAVAGRSEGLASILALSGADVISFSGGFPDPVTFPGESVADLMRLLIASGDTSIMQYAPTPGLPGPRAFMAERLERLEGRRPADDELLLTSGGIEAMSLVARSFVDPGDVVLVEGPTYLGAIMAFRGYEADVRAVPIDGDGLLPDELDRAVAAAGRVKFLYTIPDYQNPAGVSLSQERRRAVVELADRHGFLVLEDVAYRELGFGGPRLPSMWTMAPHTVVQIGTFSKTFFPGVRLGWAAGPSDVVAEMVRAKQTTDQCAGALGQRLLEEYGRRGDLDRGIERSRAFYRGRWDLLAEALEEQMPPGVSWTRPEGGFFTWLTLTGDADAEALARRAMDEGVAFVPGSPFFPDGRGRQNLRLAFSRIDDDQIAEGARRLGRVFRKGMAAA